MPAEKSTTKTRQRKGVPTFYYRIACDLERFAADDDSSPEAYSAALDILLELSNMTQVGVAHPALVKAFFLEATRTLRTAGDDRRERICAEVNLLSRVLASADSPAALAEILKDTAYRPDDCEEAPARPARVVDLACWAQSHPRPVRSLLFAEKGASNDKE